MTARSSGIAVFCKSIQIQFSPQAHKKKTTSKTNGLIEAKKNKKEKKTKQTP